MSNIEISLVGGFMSIFISKWAHRKVILNSSVCAGLDTIQYLLEALGKDENTFTENLS